ncbi:MAG: aromatic amino acid lyase [Pseudomonadota bacterium]
MTDVVLDGSSLTVSSLILMAGSQVRIALDPEGLARMAKSRQHIDSAIASGDAVYGVTTGLGSKSVEGLTDDDIARFSTHTLRGRAHAIGEPASVMAVRAAMIIRVNTMLRGHSGARPEVAEHLTACLNAQITPLVGSIGSIGVADLLPNSGIGLALIGEGRMIDKTGREDNATAIMAAHGLMPLQLGARDGLALASHSGLVTGEAALALDAAAFAFSLSQSAAALSLEAFHANFSPLDDRALRLSPMPGQMAAAEDLRLRLEGSALFEPGSARRLQDPLSFRNIPQIHGTVAAALRTTRETVNTALNAVSDNPVVLLEDGEIVSGGLYFTSELCNAVETLSRSFVHLAAAQIARTGKHMAPALSGLPAHLVQDGAASAGLAPLMKLHESLFSRLSQAAHPAPIWPSASANGVEDCVAGAPTAVSALRVVAAYSLQMSTVELIVACRAHALREPKLPIAPKSQALVDFVQEVSPNRASDAPLSDDIERLHDALMAKTAVVPMFDQL